MIKERRHFLPSAPSLFAPLGDKCVGCGRQIKILKGQFDKLLGQIDEVPLSQVWDKYGPTAKDLISGPSGNGEREVVALDFSGKGRCQTSLDI